MFLRIILIFMSFLLCYGHNNDCSDLLSNLEVTSDHASTSVSGYAIRFSHTLLDVNQGYVPGVNYTITILTPALNPIRRVILTSMSVRKSKRESIGNFYYENTGFTSIDCKRPNTKYGILTMIVAGPVDRITNLSFIWIAPRDVAPDCALFKISILLESSQRIVLKERICKNKGSYRFLNGPSGSEEFSWPGPRGRMLIITAEKSHNIYMQILGANYSQSDQTVITGDCPGAIVRASTNAVEKNFTESWSYRICITDSSFKYSNVVSSDGPVGIVHVMVPPGGHLRFTFTYYISPFENGCNSTIIHKKSGVIQNPDYPSNYTGAIDCYYKIQIEKHERIIGRFIELHFPEGHSDEKCTTADFLQFQTGEISSVWCRSKLVTFDHEFQSSDNTLIAHVHSEPIDGQDRPIFKFIWRAFSSCPPWQRFFGIRGTITSPNYPRSYLNNQQCLYTIEVPAGYVVQLKFTDFRLQPTDRSVIDCQNVPYAHDYVQIGDRKFCGNLTGRTDFLIFRSTSNLINFTFVSDQWTTIDGGFSAEFRAVVPNNSGECGPGGSYFSDLCYHVNEQAIDWQSVRGSDHSTDPGQCAVDIQARLRCLEEGGMLAVVPTEPVQQFLNGLLRSMDSNEDKAYWIGGNDMKYEGDFVWVDGRKLTYSNWFSGWPQFDNYNKQPNDDGLSNQDCIEMRRLFLYPSKGYGYAGEFYWNDRDCQIKNAFICQYPKLGASTPLITNDQSTQCNETITLTGTTRPVSFSSPHYPHPYSDSIHCYITIQAAPPGYVLIIEFSHFVLEEHEHCHYDYLEIWEENGTNTRFNFDKYCGDWTDKIKLFRRIVEQRRIVLHFNTDHSRVYSGYHFTVYMDNIALTGTLSQCNDKNWVRLDQDCYLLVYYPQVDWNKANEICQLNGHSLVIPRTQVEEEFIIQQFVASADYKISSKLWLGAQWRTVLGEWQLRMDREHFNYTEITEGRIINQTIMVHDTGALLIPTFPFAYPNFFNYAARLISAENTRILITLEWIDTEYQCDCLYDYIDLRTLENDQPFRLCGSIDDRKHNFSSYSNRAWIHFHSDHSINGKGFSLIWRVINISDCYGEITGNNGYISSVNFPKFYLNSLDCMSTIRAEKGARIILDFIYFDVGENSTLNCYHTDYVTVYMDGDLNSHRWIRLCGKLNTANISKALTYISFGNIIRVSFHSDHKDWAIGYKAQYESVFGSELDELIDLDPNQTRHMISSPNYPLAYPNDLWLKRTYRVPYGYQIHLQLEQVHARFYQIDGDSIFLSNIGKDGYSPINENISIRTYWNKLIIDIQPDGSINNSQNWSGKFKGTIVIEEDPLFWRNKTASNTTGLIDSCNPNPCWNGASCVTDPDGHYCKCTLSYTGTFCRLSQCDFNPCVHGQCRVTGDMDQFVCHCRLGYTGKLCEEEIHACASNPCQNGRCLEGLGAFTCDCFEGYKGELCGKKNLFDATTLKESFFRDPFWLGLFLVLGVMGLVGATHCFRNRFKYGGFSRIQRTGDGQRGNGEREIEDEPASALCNTCHTTGRRLGSNGLTEGENGEVYFTLQDLGIGPAQYPNLGHYEKVTFKLKLADLSDDELDILEGYLERVAATMDGQGIDPDGSVLSMATSTASDSWTVTRRNTAMALEHVASIILKSAEIVDDQQLQRRRIWRRASSNPYFPSPTTRKISTPLRQVQCIRGAAKKALQRVRRPRSVEMDDSVDMTADSSSTSFPLAHTATVTKTSASTKSE